MKVILVINKSNNIEAVLKEKEVYQVTRSYISDLTEENLNYILKSFIEQKYRQSQKYGLQFDKGKMISDSAVLIAKISDVEQIYGNYYAHEYDKYALGVATKTVYKDNQGNKYDNVLIKCIDSSLSVMDGYWEDLYSNGCGDTFSPSSKFTI